MKGAASFQPYADRMLTFEVGCSVFALPIEAVLEVAEADRATCVPGVPAHIAGVMNWHGDPLPLFSSRLLLAGSHPSGDEGADSAQISSETAEEDGEALLREQVLVLSRRGDESAQLGMPVDRVIGLVEGRPAGGRSAQVVVERRPVDGRVVSVLDPQRLVGRAEEIIESLEIHSGEQRWLES